MTMISGISDPAQ